MLEYIDSLNRRTDSSSSKDQKHKNRKVSLSVHYTYSLCLAQCVFLFFFVFVLPVPVLAFTGRSGPTRQHRLLDQLHPHAREQEGADRAGRHASGPDQELRLSRARKEDHRLHEHTVSDIS